MSATYTIKHTGLMFKADMILAYIEGRKNQTRRTKGLSLFNENPDEWELIFSPLEPGTRFVSFSHKQKKNLIIHVNMPYGGIGDQLYFKETWKMWEREEDGRDFLHYRADDAKVDPEWWTENDWTRPDPVWHKKDVFHKWQSSMFMPMICSRFRRLQIVGVRVERLQDITEREAQLEGWSLKYADPYKTYIPETSDQARQWYMGLWNSINGKTLPADKNPWVWVYEFPRHIS